MTNSCIDCHTYNRWLFGEGFTGPSGDAGSRSTHEALAAAWDELYP